MKNQFAQPEETYLEVEPDEVLGGNYMVHENEDGFEFAFEYPFSEEANMDMKDIGGLWNRDTQCWNVQAPKRNDKMVFDFIKQYGLVEKKR